MSLDVYLTLKGAAVQRKSSGIFIRENGATVEISEEEWNRRNPDREPVRFIASEPEETDELYSSNITHNLNRMAGEAGVYMALWRPEEVGIKKAEQLIAPLTEGLKCLHADPEKFKQFNPPNGWGDYEGLVKFIERYLLACIKYPEASVEVSR